MRKLVYVYAIAVAMMATAFAQGENPQVRREIEQVFFRMDRMAERGDVNGIMAMMSPKIVVTDANGRVTGWNELRAVGRRMANNMRDAKIHTRIETIQTQGPEVVAWTTTTAQYRQRRNGNWVPMTMTTRCAHTLKLMDRQWMFVASQNLPKT